MAILAEIRVIYRKILAIKYIKHHLRCSCTIDLKTLAIVAEALEKCFFEILDFIQHVFHYVSLPEKFHIQE